MNRSNTCCTNVAVSFSMLSPDSWPYSSLIFLKPSIPTIARLVGMLLVFDRLSEVFNLIFSSSQQKGSMEEMLEVDTKRKHCLSALDSLKRNIS